MATAKTDNFNEWDRAFKVWMKARGKSHDEVINDFGGSSCLFAAKFTPRARKTKFLGTAYKPKPPSRVTVLTPENRKKIANAVNDMLAQKELVSKAVERIKKGTGSRGRKKKFYHALATGLRRKKGGWNKYKGVVKGRGNYDEALRLWSSRRSSIGASAAGFLEPAKDFGKKLTTRRGVKVKSGGSASKSFAIKSRAGNMKADSFNEVKDSAKVAGPAMRKAMVHVIRREGNLAIKKIQKTNNTFSAKPF